MDELAMLKNELREQDQYGSELIRRSVALTKMRQDIETFLVRAASVAQASLGSDWEVHKRDAKRCQGLFNEYVDLLRGVAVREVGFDRNVFVVADCLPLLWGPDQHGTLWQSLAIPARAERQMPTVARVLRIGFPEWTAWALPLVQHELAHVFVSRSTNLRRVAFGDSVLEYERTPKAIYLADAAATLVTGPAYAFAALLMRLDPSQVRRDEPTCWRSAVIITALEKAARDAPGPLRYTVERLRAEWREAVEDAGGDPDFFDSGFHTYDPENPVKVLRPANEAVTSVVEAVWRERNLTAQRPGWSTSWEDVGEWTKQLRQPEGTFDAAVSKSRTRDLPAAIALVLNASWLARVGVAPADDARPQDLPRIEQRATNWCMKLVDEFAEHEKPSREGHKQL